jgi:hypothetical protein
MALPGMEPRNTRNTRNQSTPGFFRVFGVFRGFPFRAKNSNFTRREFYFALRLHLIGGGVRTHRPGVWTLAHQRCAGLVCCAPLVRLRRGLRSVQTPGLDGRRVDVRGVWSCSRAPVRKRHPKLSRSVPKIGGAIQRPAGRSKDRKSRTFDDSG